MKGLVLATAFSVLLLAGIATNQSFGDDAHSYILEWGSYGNIDGGQFFHLESISVDKEGNVYVTDSGNARVQKFTSDGQFLETWGVSGTGNGEFTSPIGIATYENNVYVVDNEQNRVQVFDSEGKFLQSWGEFGSEQGEFFYPQGISISNDGIIFVADTKNHRIQQFTVDGEFLSSFGIFGPGDGRLRAPVDVALGEDYVYVSDPGNFKIEKYTFEGISVASFDYNFGGYPIRPNGLTVDPDGNVYLTDSYKQRIIKIDSEGNTLKIFGGVGNDKGQFTEPKDIVLDDRGYLFVTDFANNRIQKFETSIVMKIEEVLAAEQAKKLEELTYEEESNDVNVESHEQETVTEEPPVRDLTNPILAPPRDMTIEATGGFTTVNIGEAMAMDESGIQFLINNAPERFGLGTAIIIWTAIDNNGNSTIATQEINVVDTTSPTISSVSDMVVEAAVPYENIVNLEAPTTHDILGVISIISDAPEFFPLGETIVTWTATDVVGNTSTTEQKVIVVDNTLPILQAPEDIIIEATSIDNNEVDLGESSATDNGEIISISNDAPQFFALGDTIITWVVSDSSENIASDTQLVSVVDTTAPEILPVDDLTYEATSMDQNTVHLGNPPVSDIQEVTITNNAPEFFPLGETIVTWTATDVVGNTSTTEQKVIVVDNTAPDLTIPEDQIVEATSIEETLVTIGEAEAHDITGISSITNNSPEVFSLGSTVVTWTSIDNSGNTTIFEQTITVVDTTPPSIFVPADIVAEAVDPVLNFIELGDATTYDHVDIESVTNDRPDSFSFGSTTITWTAVDTSGNISKGIQIVTIIDTTIPEVVAPSDVIVEATGILNIVVEIGEATIYDIIQVDTITSDSPDTFPLGETVITWTATDSSGNSATATQTVTVVDTTAPSVTAPDSIEVEATSVDNTVEIGNPVYDDLVEIISVTSDSPDTFPLGETVITWTATDSSGNSATATQTVTVVDTTAPSVTAPDSITIEASGAEGNLADIGLGSGSDTVEIISVTSDSPDTFPLGETVITWTATDSSGNSATATQTVTVVDTTAPELTVPENIVVDSFSLENLVAIGNADALDLVDASPTITNDAPEIFPLGDTTVTWNVADNFGNSNSFQQIVSVQACGQSLSDYNQILGTSEDDILIGTAASDLIFALGGNDIIFGGEGNDCIIGGEGDDLIFGNTGNDHLVGGEGYDIIKGHSGDDKLTGGPGFDVIDGGDDHDTSYDSASDIVIKCEEEL
uniref:Outer membrane phospholipase A n=1 Tax=uncultured marine thaumarchaeote KM3_79_H02 TaxID=1456297 RepID=A0A075HVX6_9ARCH|nr:Outer membrane phospholipase A [uncultured marine thaumarchaeote KM3_79_H02]